jgi:tetratricopeptide (TPR) repeat protein
MKKTNRDLESQAKSPFDLAAVMQGRSLDEIMLEAKLLRKPEKRQLADLLFNRVSQLFNEQSNDKEVKKLLKSVLKLDEKHAAAHLALAHLIVDTSTKFKDISHHQKASDHFKRAEELYQLENRALPAESYWKWGICDFFFANFSEEPIDLKNASDKFKKAHDQGLVNGSFLVDYGSLLTELGSMMRNKELILQAAELLKQGLENDGENPHGWLRLALAYKVVYAWTLDYSFFEKADHSFVAAARVLGDNIVLWINWGDLLAKEGFGVRDAQVLNAGIEKIERALMLDPTSSQIKLRLADAVMHLGRIEEDLDALKHALSLLQEVESEEKNNVHFVSLMGDCLVQLGRYFGDASYYREAIQIIEERLKEENNNPILWHVLAMAYMALGDLKTDHKAYDQAAKFYGQAIRTAPTPIPEWLNEQGIALMKIGEASQDPYYIRSAMEKFERAVFLFQKNGGGSPDPEWVYNFGAALSYLGEFEGDPKHFERAIAVLGRLLEQYPNFHYVKYNLAMALFHLGDMLGEIEPLEKAEELFEQVMQDDPDADFVLEDFGYALMVLGDLLEESGHGFLKAKACFEKAESLLLESVRLGSAQANYLLASLYALLGRYHESMHFLERAKQRSVLPPMATLLEDGWFEDMRDLPEFRLFLAGLPEENA